jgi:hypothetical protein
VAIRRFPAKAMVDLGQNPKPIPQPASLNPITTSVTPCRLSLMKQVEITFAKTTKPAMAFYEQLNDVKYGTQIICKPTETDNIHILQDWTDDTLLACIVSPILYYRVQIFNAENDGPYKEFYHYQPAFHILKILNRFTNLIDTNIELRADLGQLYKACYVAVRFQNLELRIHAETLLAMFFFTSDIISVTEKTTERQSCVVKWWQTLQSENGARVTFTTMANKKSIDKTLMWSDIINNSSPDVKFPQVTEVRSCCRINFPDAWADRLVTAF